MFDYEEMMDWLADMGEAAEDIAIGFFCLLALLAAVSPAFA